ncbi:hypothetical protein B0T24DRAFT_724225 [Lasiosphaeria ovina]|uniref:Uncharacterized protein n=1 Tax=Lasiosphaeria ovina TaxID=92902 RepID=A0AAE0JUG0_9PEZI|nr:hypothetical protein B0T24DRAFT_724225 [Lasiosphaeria ovina]
MRRASPLILAPSVHNNKTLEVSLKHMGLVTSRRQRQTHAVGHSGLARRYAAERQARTPVTYEVARKQSSDMLAWRHDILPEIGPSRIAFQDRDKVTFKFDRTKTSELQASDGTVNWHTRTVGRRYAAKSEQFKLETSREAGEAFLNTVLHRARGWNAPVLNITVDYEDMLTLQENVDKLDGELVQDAELAELERRKGLTCLNCNSAGKEAMTEAIKRRLRQYDLWSAAKDTIQPSERGGRFDEGRAENRPITRHAFLDAESILAAANTAVDAYARHGIQETGRVNANRADSIIFEMLDAAAEL